MTHEQLFTFNLSTKEKRETIEWYVNNGYVSSENAIFISLPDYEDHFIEVGKDPTKESSFYLTGADYVIPYTGDQFGTRRKKLV